MANEKRGVFLTDEEYDQLTQTKTTRKRGLMFKSITAWLFVTTQVAALFWVSSSYAIAFYATVALGQPYPIETLSEQAITTLLGVTALKVIENIFEHNDGALFGHNNNGKGEEV